MTFNTSSNTKYSKILITRFSSIGDIVLTTPVIRCIHQQLNVEVHYITKKAYRNILSDNPYIHKVWTIEKEIDELIPALKAEQFDHIVDLHHNLRTLRLKLKLGVPSSSFPKLNIEKWLLTNLKINRLPDIHIVQRYFKTVEQLGVYNDEAGLDYFIPDKDCVDLGNLGLATRPYISFAIGAKFATKRMPTNKIIEICSHINLPIVLLGGKEDQDTGQQIAAASGLHVINACGQYSLNGSASLVQQSFLLITHDTGLMHIGAALQKPIISIWGSTVPEFGMYPYRCQHHKIEVSGLFCRPCSKIGYNTCPKKHFNCMQQIDIDHIRELIHQYSAF